MEFSCLFFDQDGEVCFAEVITAFSLADAMGKARRGFPMAPPYAWLELWLEGERVASSRDDPRPASAERAGTGLH